MTTLANILLEKEILLESGTNELEVLVFDVAEYRFGINVAKVREVLPTVPITHLPKAHPSIRGVFKLRNRVIPCVSLLDYLEIPSTKENAESTMILTDLNQQQTAFLVDGVQRIHRLSWQNILAVPNLEALSHTPVTALARCEDRLVVMLDFEMILDEITSQYFRTDAVENPLGVHREKLKILLAEDSATVREAIGSTLYKSGYQHLEFFENGMKAWEWLNQRLAETSQVADFADLLICDVEMPQMDGFHLTKQIKDHPQLKALPVLLYSSIITPENRQKGLAVGADAQVSKPELQEVVRLADELITKAQREHRSAEWQHVAALSQEVFHDMSLTDCSSQDGLEEEKSFSVPKTEVSQTSEQSPEKTSAYVEVPRGSQVSQDTVPLSSQEQKSIPLSENPKMLEQKLREEEQTQGPRLFREEIPPPQGMDAKLWTIFMTELGSLADRLRELLDEAEAGHRSDGFITETLRILHTMKSAAMVVPVDPVVRLVHLLEGLIIQARDEDRNKWPQAQLRCFLECIQQLRTPGNDPNQILAAAARLEQEIA